VTSAKHPVLLLLVLFLAILLSCHYLILFFFRYLVLLRFLCITLLLLDSIPFMTENTFNIFLHLYLNGIGVYKLIWKLKEGGLVVVW
jgi:hypothetical protein